MRINAIFWCLLLSFSIIEAGITVMTAPVGKGPQAGGGHAGVTKSLLAGLKKINYDFNYNITSLDQLKETMIVLSDIESLQQAIMLKRSGKIKKLLAGPNLMVRANEYNNILSSPEIDVCIVPSQWVKIAYEEDAPALIGRIRTWFAGIDETQWIPQRYSKTNNVLVYWKTEPEFFCSTVENVLRRYGFNPVRITYGKYDKQVYKDLLSKVVFAVFISISESQGLALLEAWAMDVPTMVWNAKRLTAHNRVYNVCSACPYLTEYTGKDWQTVAELEAILGQFSRGIFHFSPRQWVLHHMTDVCSAQHLIKILEE